MKGIMFKPDFFQAVIKGRKTQTRRTGGLDLVNQDPDNNKFVILTKDPEVCWINKPEIQNEPRQLKGTYALFLIFHSEYNYQYFRPRYQPGDIVYLKEPYINSKADGLIYRYQSSLEDSEYDHFPWQNKMFMPAKYARHFIRIDSVRAERVKHITLGDALYEGVHPYAPKEAFQKRWVEINGQGSWNTNPWVWVYHFKYLEKVHTLAEANSLLHSSC